MWVIICVHIKRILKQIQFISGLKMNYFAYVSSSLSMSYIYCKIFSMWRYKKQFLVLVLYHYYVVVFNIISTPKQNSLLYSPVKSKYKQQNTHTKNSLCFKKSCTKMSANNRTCIFQKDSLHATKCNRNLWISICLSSPYLSVWIFK